MAEVQCVSCEIRACAGDIERAPDSCPRRNAKEALEEAEKILATDPEVQEIISAAKSLEEEGCGVWPRVRELVEFSKRLGLKKLGIAFCAGLKEEATQLAEILESRGFELSSVACTVNGGCNPVGQALVLNQLGTELNVVLGLCMGHDVLFTKFSKAPATTLVVKDRVMFHNPAALLVSRHWRDTLLNSE